MKIIVTKKTKITHNFHKKAVTTASIWETLSILLLKHISICNVIFETYLILRF